jgi:hypothetical protein
MVVVEEAVLVVAVIVITKYFDYFSEYFQPHSGIMLLK